jgi:hypothetical protein
VLLLLLVQRQLLMQLVVLSVSLLVPALVMVVKVEI